MTEQKPTVLFLCVKNGGKSQMAAALMRQHAGGAVEVYSAGTKPGTALNRESRASIEAVGASFEGECPKAIDPGILARADRVVVIGTEAEPPEHPNVTVWDTEEPCLRGIEGSERMDLIRDDILRRVKDLTAELIPGATR